MKELGLVDWKFTIDEWTFSLVSKNLWLLSLLLSLPY